METSLKSQASDWLKWQSVNISANQMLEFETGFESQFYDQSPFQPIRCLRFETGFQSQFYDQSPFQPIRCLRFQTGFQSQFYNLQPTVFKFMDLNFLNDVNIIQA
jgi:hypothetical protein